MRETDFKERFTGLFCLYFFFSRMSLNALLINVCNSGVDSNYYSLNTTFGWGGFIEIVKSSTDCRSSSHHSYGVFPQFTSTSAALSGTVVACVYGRTGSSSAAGAAARADAP